jgi:hypothetical protein
MPIRRRRRPPITLAGVAIAALVGGVLALVPRPSLSLGREMRVNDEVPVVTKLFAQHQRIADFRMIGLSWNGPAKPTFAVRTSERGVWSAWKALDAADSGPDPQSKEGRQARMTSEPMWVGQADGYEVQVPDGVTAVRVHLVRETGPRIHLQSSSTDAHAAAPQPGINLRSSWGARAPKDPPEYASTVQMAFVHHTVSSNTYAPGDVPSILRSIQAYHMDSNGWNDIGYNFLVDRFGGIWEGRGGGIDRPVVGAQVLGFNSGSTGVAVIGDFTSTAPSGAALDAVGRLLAWKLSLTNVDPMGINNFTSADTSQGAKYPAGTVATLNNISGHKDANYTDCPAQLYNYLPQIRNTAKAWWGAFLAFPAGFGGGAYVATGEFTGDSTSEVVTGAGPGGGPAVEVWRENGQNLGGFYAFPQGFGGGVRVATGKVELGGTTEDVVTGAGPGGGPAVEAFRLNGQNVGGFYAYAPNFGGGVYVAAGPMNRLPGDEIVTGAGAGGGPHVRIFSLNGTALGGFMAYAPNFGGGVRVAVGDVDGDGVDEIITAPGPGGGPHIRVFRLDGTEIGSFMAYNPNFIGGVYVTTVKSPDGKTSWIATGAGEGGGTQVRIFDYHGNLGANGFFYGSPADTSGVRLAGGSFIGTVPGQLAITEGPGALPFVGYRRLDGPAFFPS